jgi:hypothetical protein
MSFMNFAASRLSVQASKCKADGGGTYTAEIKNVWISTSSPSVVRPRIAVKDRNKSAFTVVEDSSSSGFDSLIYKPDTVEVWLNKRNA